MKKALKIAAWGLLVLFVLFALLLWGFIELMSPEPHEYLPTRGPRGQVAHLERPGGTMEPIYYSVKVHGAYLAGECTAVRLEGYEAERWVRLAWDGPALVVRYGLPRNPEAKGQAPVTPAESGCNGVPVRIVRDDSLVPTQFLGDPIASSEPTQAD